MGLPEFGAPSSQPEVEVAGERRAPEWVRKLQDGPEYQRRFFAQVLLAGVLFALSSVVEAVVPLIRVLLRRRGVQVGPAIGSFLAFAGGFVWLSRVDAEEDQTGRGPVAFVREHSLEMAAVGLPALGAVLPVTGVAPRRSPLLAWALMPFPRIAGSFLLAWSIDRARKRALPPPESSEEMR